jgi:hypothetical protein
MAGLRGARRQSRLSGVYSLALSLQAVGVGMPTVLVSGITVGGTKRTAAGMMG